MRCRKIKFSEEEEKYRNSNKLEESELLRKSMLCSSCNKNIKPLILLKNKVYVHPVLEVLWCKSCQDFYNDGNFSTDEDGSDKYCRWCAEGGTLYCCSSCSCTFCKKCIKRNLPRKVLDDIEDDQWKCFVCVSEPIWPLRSFCKNVLDLIEKRTSKNKSNNDNKTETNKSDIKIKKQKSTKSLGSLKDTNEEITNENILETDPSDRKLSKRRFLRSSDNSNDEKNEENSDSDHIRKKRFLRKNTSALEDTTSEEKKIKEKHAQNKTIKNDHSTNVKKLNQITNSVKDFLTEYSNLRKVMEKSENAFKRNYLQREILEDSNNISEVTTAVRKLINDNVESLKKLEKRFEENAQNVSASTIDENCSVAVEDKCITNYNGTTETPINSISNENTDELSTEDEKGPVENPAEILSMDTDEDNNEADEMKNGTDLGDENENQDTQTTSDVDDKIEDIISESNTQNQNAINETIEYANTITENNKILRMVMNNNYRLSEDSDSCALSLSIPNTDENEVPLNNNTSLFVNVSSATNSNLENDSTVLLMNNSVDEISEKSHSTMQEQNESKTINDDHDKVEKSNIDDANKITDKNAVDTGCPGPSVNSLAEISDRNKIAKASLLQNSSDSETNQKSNESDISGIDYLNSDEEQKEKV